MGYKTEFPCAVCRERVHIMVCKLAINEVMGFVVFICPMCWERRPEHTRENTTKLIPEMMWTLHQN